MRWLKKALRQWLGVAEDIESLHQHIGIVDRYYQGRIREVLEEARIEVANGLEPTRTRLTSLESFRSTVDRQLKAIFGIKTDSGDTIGKIVDSVDRAIADADKDRLHASAAKLRGMTIEDYRSDLAKRKKDKAAALLDSVRSTQPRNPGAIMTLESIIGQPLTLPRAIEAFEVQFGEVVKVDVYEPDIKKVCSGGVVEEGEPVKGISKNEVEAIQSWLDAALEFAGDNLMSKQLVWRIYPEMVREYDAETGGVRCFVRSRFAVRNADSAAEKRETVQ
jgi:hypothetical protein